jgi:arylsulfatase A-like enzyme
MLKRREFVALWGMRPAFAESGPNLLYILIDQLSGLALPAQDTNARMPTCQNLAQSGVTFTHAYTAAMTCGPSRASLDSGLYPPAHGVGSGVRPAPSFPTLQTTLAGQGFTLSHPNGYSLESERKEHEKWLADLGYEQPLTSNEGAASMARYLDLPLKWKCGRTGLAPEHAFDAYCAQRAIRFLETNRSRPFACFLQLRGPHEPYMAPRPFDTLIDPASLALPPYRTGEFETKPARQRLSFQTQGAARMSDDQIRRILALYYGMAAFSDRCAGQVLTRLKELGLDDNTVVVLLADHGDTMGRHRIVSKDFGFYEPAIRIPLIIRAPGSRPRGIECADPVSGVDVFPTLCDLMGLPKPDGLQGQSLVGRWEGRDRNPRRPIFSAQGTPGKNFARMVRTSQYKYARYDDGGQELYDLERDPNEFENRVDYPDYRATAGRLDAQLNEWQRTSAAVTHGG